MKRDILSLIATAVFAASAPGATTTRPLLIQAAPTPAASYTLTDLGSSDGHTIATALNEKGQVVGNGKDYAFLWSNGQRTSLKGIPSPMGNDWSRANAINNHGAVVGSSGGYFPIVMSGLEEAGAFVYQNGKMSKVGGRNDWSSFEAYGINDRGDIVGLDGYRGFVWMKGRFISLATLSKHPRGNGSRAAAINNRGQVVGGTTVNRPGDGLPVHAFLWQKGKMKDLGGLHPYSNSVATAINDAGQIVGYASNNAQWRSATLYTPGRAILWSEGKPHPLPHLSGTTQSQANAINNRGEIVGESGGHAVLWKGGRFFDLNNGIDPAAGWTLTEARDVNDHGWIVGAGKRNGEKELRAFLLTPR